MTTPQVLVTQSTQATVEITAADPAVVEVSAPSVPSVIEVEVPGPQGPIGPIRQPDALRIDTSASGVVFTGKAPNGAAEDAAVWTITRTIYNAAGVRQSKGTATGVTWTGRAGHTYV